MNIKIKRTTFTDVSTIGELYVDGAFECYTLEDKVRTVKVYAKTAIPAGTYKVILNMSNRFKKILPLLISVPGFEGIRIHPGNTAADTEGCLLVGTTKASDFVGNSKIAFNKLMAKMEKAETITLTIS